MNDFYLLELHAAALASWASEEKKWKIVGKEKESAHVLHIIYAL